MNDFDFSPAEAAALPPVSREGKKLTLCFSIGRSGQRWLARVFDLHEDCSGGCERHPAAEPFVRYCAYNELPIDPSGYEALLWQSIFYDWHRASHSFCASPYWCFNALQLVRSMKPDAVIWVVRDPDRTIASFSDKGWYNRLPTHDPELGIPGIQPEHWNFPYRSFGRILPRDEATQRRWSELLPTARVAWFAEQAICALEDDWASIVEVVPKALKLRLEDLDQQYPAYRELASWGDLEPVFPKRKFLGIKDRMSNRGGRKRKKTSPAEWDSETREQVEGMIPRYRRIHAAIEPIGR